MTTRTVEFPETGQMEAIRAGDLSTYEMLFKTWYQPLCQYAYSFLQDREDAEEIVQSTFVNVWEKRESLAIHTGVKPYLYAMVRNASLNAIKHEKIRQRHADHSLQMADQGYNSVSGTIQGAELESLIQKAIEQLPEQCKLIFKMSRYEELKYAEIAEQLNLSVKTVENQIGKALKIMRENLKEYLPTLFIFIQWLVM